MKNRRLNKLTFTISPNPNGYVVGCSEIPSLFTDVSSVTEIDLIVQNLVSEYVDTFPDDAEKRGVDKKIPTEMVWRASPNSVALE